MGFHASFLTDFGVHQLTQRYKDHVYARIYTMGVCVLKLAYKFYISIRCLDINIQASMG